MKSAGTWNVALGVAVVASAVLIVAVAVLSGPVQDAEEDDHFASFAPTTVMVVASGEGKYRCADVYNCQCAEASGAPTCGGINHEGVCSYVVAEPERSLLPTCQYSRCMPRLFQGRLLLLQVCADPTCNGGCVPCLTACVRVCVCHRCSWSLCLQLPVTAGRCVRVERYVVRPHPW